MEVFIGNDISFNGLSIFFTKRVGNARQVALPVRLEFEELSDGCSPITPTLYIPVGAMQNFMQSMMDELWNKGVRPTGEVPLKNELDAVHYHLEDMRKLVFKG